jgi:hypothetical protein
VVTEAFAHRVIDSLTHLAAMHDILIPAVEVRWDCPQMLEDHTKDERCLGHHHFDRPDEICLHPDLLEYSPETVAGVVAHEIGHLMSKDDHDDSAEGSADEWMRQKLGIEIYYGTDSTLECLGERDMGRLGLTP